ncbi:hypothetical protein NEOLEDRAFT_1174969 [Neolentinus lepideus HHB14362 ss-1]|uniref:DUF6534 domain-containing protein n=1 Tax=Neolentinus lepideus HHB14362 ss-1 TaxID=1314782 RepID=A0A165V6V7_9AGAM|nr:hypothetical protein NEOLEDRAFT_1174969 [Neolentinus lepideus HHB14362 ss-1]
MVALELRASRTGPILLEALLQSLCQGVVFSQAARYWDSRREDTFALKSYVGILVVLSVLQTSLEIYKAWFVTILHHQWSASPLKWTDILLNGTIVVLCEVFLVRRCWLATNKKIWILVPLAVLTLSIFVVCVILAVEVGLTAGDVTVEDPLRANTRHFGSAGFAFSYWIFGSLVLDALVTVILSIFLWRSKTGLNYLDKTLRHIIGISWESAAVPFISELVAVCIYNALPHVNYQLVLLFVLSTGKFYTIGILRSLAYRVQLRARLQSTDLGRTSLSGWNWDQERTAVDRLSIAEASPLDNPVTNRPSISSTAVGSDDAVSDITRVAESTAEVHFADTPKPLTRRLTALNTADENAS